jgi:hypothetical protein
VKGNAITLVILSRYVPRELEKEVRQNHKTVAVEDKRQEDYHEPPPRFGYHANHLVSETYFF